MWFQLALFWSTKSSKNLAARQIGEVADLSFLVHLGRKRYETARSPLEI